MAREIAPEAAWLAKKFYCIDRLSLSETAKAVRAPLAAVKAWAQEFCWKEERARIASLETEIQTNIVAARADALRKLLASEEDKERSQALAVVDKLERLALGAARFEHSRRKSVSAEREEKAKERPAGAGNGSLPAGLSEAERTALLEEAVNRQIAFILQNPVDDMSSRVKEIKSGLDILASLKGKGAQPLIRVSFDE